MFVGASTISSKYLSHFLTSILTNVMNMMGDRELVSSAGCSRCLFVKDHRRRQVAGSRGRQKVIHRGPKRQQYRQGKG